MRLQDDPKRLYDDAYRGRVALSGMQQYQERIEQRRVLLDELKEPELWFWTPAFADAISEVEANVRPGGTVLEIGSAMGYVLHALRARGFEAVGLEPAKTAVDLLVADGFQVWHGTLNGLPKDWVEPDAILSFFVLHHLDEPVQFVSRLREDYPRALLALAAHGHGLNQDRIDHRFSQPPRTLTRWTAPSLGRLLEAGGYEATVRVYPSAVPGTRAFARIEGAMRLLRKAPRAYRAFKLLKARILRRLPDRAQNTEGTLLALARPRA